MKNPLYSLCCQVSHASLPCAIKIPDYTILEVLWLRKKSEGYKLCCADMHQLKERKGEQGLMALTHTTGGSLEKNQMIR